MAQFDGIVMGFDGTLVVSLADIARFVTIKTYIVTTIFESAPELLAISKRPVRLGSAEA